LYLRIMSYCGQNISSWYTSSVRPVRPVHPLRPTWQFGSRRAGLRMRQVAPNSQRQAHGCTWGDTTKVVHLQVVLGVPVVLKEDDGVRRRQVQPQAAHLADGARVFRDSGVKRRSSITERECTRMGLISLSFCQLMPLVKTSVACLDDCVPNTEQ